MISIKRVFRISKWSLGSLLLDLAHLLLLCACGWCFYFIFYSPIFGAEVPLAKPSLEALQQRAKEQAKGMNLDAAQQKAQAQTKEMQVQDRALGEGEELPNQAKFNEAFQKELDRQGKDVFAPKTQNNPFAGPEARQQLQQAGKAMAASRPMQGERLYVLVSSSMPIGVLRNYLADAGRIQDARVEVSIRGLVGKMPDTLAWTRRMILKDPNCPLTIKCKELWPLNINPNPFRQFGVTQVPAIAWAKAPARGQEFRPEEFIIVRGDVSLAYALHKLADQPASAGFAKELLAKLQQPKSKGNP